MRRRKLLQGTITALAASTISHQQIAAMQPPSLLEAVKVPSEAEGVELLTPRGRVPLSFIIDDSTCLVNMGHFCMPQFARAWPDREIYHQPWQKWPREIPDSFVREFGEWCHQQGVKGKYSIVPYPACVGWLDRELPGWSSRALRESLDLVRELMVPDWDIHPEMITHTRIIDLKTGRPMARAESATMENSYPQTEISTDHLTEYLAYALRILKNCGLPCEGITTPGGFGNRVKPQLPVAVNQSLRDVFSVEIAHYFKYVRSGEESTEPVLEFGPGRRTLQNLTVNVPAGTGDWFGGWEGVKASDADRYCNADASEGRMVDLIKRGQPAVMLCHWPGMYCNGTKSGFHAFQRVVSAINSRYGDQTQWMKVSEMARYWAVKGMASLRRRHAVLEIDSPADCQQFTLAIDDVDLNENPKLTHSGQTQPLAEVENRIGLVNNSFHRDGNRSLFCVDLKKGSNLLQFS